MRWILLFLISFNVFSYTLDASITGDVIKYKNAINSPSGLGKVLVSWAPSHNLLPAKNWSPGFKYTQKDITLSGPGGSVDLKQAISVIGLEYKSKDLLIESTGVSMPGAVCSADGYSNSEVYVISQVSGTPCRGKSVFSSNGKMPFYFVRPIFDIKEDKVINAFANLSNKIEGFYSGNIMINYVYAFEQNNGVKTWRNLSAPLTISFYYKPNMLTSIRLENPGVHLMKIQDKNDLEIIGETEFNIIAEGFFNNGIGLSLASSNNYELSNSTKSFRIPISIFCADCQKQELVRKGKIINGTSMIRRKNVQKIRFPIKVNFEVDKSKVPVGSYDGQFTILFTADI